MGPKAGAMDHAPTGISRRQALGGALALGAAALIPAPAQAFASNRITVTVQGAGPDVILIHGVDSATSVWTSSLRALAGHRCHLVQIAGFSGFPARGNAAGAIVKPVADEIARYIAEAKLTRPAVIGHSMGGTIALMLAARARSPVGRTMVVDMLPAPAGILGADAAGIRPFADTLRDLTATPRGQQLFQSMMGMFGSGNDLAHQSDPGVTARALHELALIDLTPDLPRITAPLTVVYATPRPGGGADPARVTQGYRAAYKGAKTARLFAIANSGHMIMFDQPVAFQAAVKAFLAAR